jgi:hypothetical protein
MAKVNFEKTHKDIFVVVDGIGVARRGYPGSQEARAWVSVEPGWQVLDSDEGIIVKHNGVAVHLERGQVHGVGWTSPCAVSWDGTADQCAHHRPARPAARRPSVQVGTTTTPYIILGSNKRDTEENRHRLPQI